MNLLTLLRSFSADIEQHLNLSKKRPPQPGPPPQPVKAVQQYYPDEEEKHIGQQEQELAKYE